MDPQSNSFLIKIWTASNCEPFHQYNKKIHPHTSPLHVYTVFHSHLYVNCKRQFDQQNQKRFWPPMANSSVAPINMVKKRFVFFRLFVDHLKTDYLYWDQFTIAPVWSHFCPFVCKPITFSTSDLKKKLWINFKLHYMRKRLWRTDGQNAKRWAIYRYKQNPVLKLKSIFSN